MVIQITVQQLSSNVCPSCSPTAWKTSPSWVSARKESADRDGRTDSLQVTILFTAGSGPPARHQRGVLNWHPRSFSVAPRSQPPISV